MKFQVLTTLFLAAFSSASALAKPPSQIIVAFCEGASVGIPYAYGADNRSTFQTVNLYDRGAVRYLLTGNSNRVENREFLIPSNEALHFNPEIDLNQDVELAASILSTTGISTQTNDPVSSYNDFYGSLGGVTDGKQVRVLLNRDSRELTVTLFDMASGSERANWIFRNCKGTLTP